MENLVNSIKSGNELAFSQAYHSSKDKLYGWALNKTHSAYLAQELLQQTYCKLWASRASLNPQLPVEVQIFRIARSLLVDEIRRQIRIKQQYELLPVPETEADLVWQACAERELKNRMEDALLTLHPTARKVFTLSRESGLTNNEIAKTLSISIKTVEYHITKALGVLRRALLFLLIVLLY